VTCLLLWLAALTEAGMHPDVKVYDNKLVKGSVQVVNFLVGKDRPGACAKARVGAR